MSHQLEMEVLDFKKFVKSLIIRIEKLEAENKILKNRLSEIELRMEMKFGMGFNNA